MISMYNGPTYYTETLPCNSCSNYILLGKKASQEKYECDLKLGNEKRNAGHTWLVDKDLELPLSWVKYGSRTCSSKSTALYIWCIENDKWSVTIKTKRDPS